jgi:hypothetical protein
LSGARESTEPLRQVLLMTKLAVGGDEEIEFGGGSDQ